MKSRGVRQEEMSGSSSIIWESELTNPGSQVDPSREERASSQVSGQMDGSAIQQERKH